ncbi:hypothetical protein [Streptomyces sp. NPDC006645]|uniref:hypothetical protein n=1 Tax=unclassified Streptomyces TaxID=2593676 RepID=UPI0033AA38FA
MSGKDETSIPDEEWERFLRDAESGAGSAPAEPSARARMVGRRLREETRPPEGWRTHQPVRRRRGKAWYLVGFVLAVGLLVVALDPGRVIGWAGDGAGDGGGSAAGVPAAGEPASQRPTPEEPFKGSPAVEWGDGTAGITVATPEATGWMTEKQVAEALDRSRDFLAASSLDPAVLGGERPTEAIALMNPHQRDVRDYVTAAFSEPGEENDPLLLFSRFAPKVRLVGDVVKTRGEMTFREGKRGAVEVVSDVTYVYPVVRATGGSDEVARTVARRETVMSWDDPAKVITEKGTFTLLSYKVDATNGGCENYTGYFLPEFIADRTDRGSGPESDPYDRSTSMDANLSEAGDVECGIASRS